MKRLMIVSALLLSASPAPLASAPAGVVRQSDAKAEYDALNKEYRAARSAFRAELRELQNSGDEDAIAAAQAHDPTGEFLGRFVDAAAGYAGLDEALPFLQWIVENGSVDRPEDGILVSDEAQAALDTILRDHIASEELGSFASKLARMGRTLGNERCRDTLGTIITKSPYMSVQLAARFSRAQLTMGDSDATKAQRRGAVKDLKTVIAESDSESTVARATSALFELENLQIGLIAPDIEANDLDGIAFKLSDYRGKVVVIDFWGDW